MNTGLLSGTVRWVGWWWTENGCSIWSKFYRKWTSWNLIIIASGQPAREWDLMRYHIDKEGGFGAAKLHHEICPDSKGPTTPPAAASKLSNWSLDKRRVWRRGEALLDSSYVCMYVLYGILYKYIGARHSRFLYFGILRHVYRLEDGQQCLPSLIRPLPIRGRFLEAITIHDNNLQSGVGKRKALQTVIRVLAPSGNSTTAPLVRIRIYGP